MLAPAAPDPGEAMRQDSATQVALELALDEAGEAGALAALARLGEERLQMPTHHLVQDGALRLAPPADAGRGARTAGQARLEPPCARQEPSGRPFHEAGQTGMSWLPERADGTSPPGVVAK